MPPLLRRPPRAESAPVGTAPAGRTATTRTPVATPGALLRYGSAGNGRLWGLVAAIVGLSAHQVAEGLVPVVIGAVIDEALAEADPGALLRLLGLLALVFVALILAWRSATRIVTRVFTGGEHDLRLLATRRVLDPRGLRARRSTGDVLAVTTDDSSNVSGFAWLVAEMGAAFAAVVTAVVALGLISWPLGAFVLVVTAGQLLLVHRLRKPLAARSRVEQDRAAEAGAIAADFATGIRVVKGLGAEREAAARYTAASERARESALHSVRASAGLGALNTVIGGAFLTVIATGAGWFALDGRISVGELVAVVGLAQFVRVPMQFLGLFGVYLASKTGSATRLAELVGAEALAAPGDGAGSEPSSQSAPPLLSLRHGGSLLEVRRGELVGIDAGTDATALVELLGFRRAIAPGEAAVDGVDAALLGPVAVRALVHAPPHDAVVFTGSIADNLHAGAEPAAGDTAAAASARWLRVSGLDEVLEHLGAGLDSPVGEQGRLLSGGQRQRLLLARALHQPQPLVVLHEPTTSVDSVTEQRIARALRDVPAEGPAILLVTSSPTLLAACHRVVAAAERPAVVGARGVGAGAAS